MKHTAFFGDGEKTFDLPAEQILELERKTGTGVGTIYSRTMTGQFQFGDIIEVIRLGLIGGGTSPKEAQALVDAYARPTPIIEAFQLAADILEARWSGKVEAPAPDAQDELRQAAATGDASAILRARIAEAYAEDYAA
ncbi:gene transfer agent family protein [Mesorhizobium sp. ESP6-5]|uniref:gene transfer agent family protein n=1 Tax=Mesorhizobium sp. ESP6-5 TaxID=2876623 RepID=UPI001CCEB7EC|nr:gene transfer agent family protein [Mesorhizobium sp. ESP6-5]MBZ9757863.1 gene transfer agent family protein [Mesorhizobium sp. ESP6-5]